MALTVIVDRARCMSSEACVTAAPQAFDVDDEGLVLVLPGVAQLTDEELIEIARGCPTAAISLETPAGETLELF
jgi:ferredoxin